VRLAHREGIRPVHALSEDDSYDPVGGRVRDEALDSADADGCVPRRRDRDIFRVSDRLGRLGCVQPRPDPLRNRYVLLPTERCGKK